MPDSKSPPPPPIVQDPVFARSKPSLTDQTTGLYSPDDPSDFTSAAGKNS